MKPLLLKTLAVALAYVSWVFSLVIANSLSWRVWEFESERIPIMHLGLWELCYLEVVNMSGQMLQVSVYTKFNSSWSLPNEIYYGQDLMLLANFLAPVALLFSTLAVWASWKQTPFPYFFRTCYNTAALHLLLSCFCVTLVVAWNFSMDLVGQTALEFPPKFLVNKSMILSKSVSYVLLLGSLASVSSFIGVILFAMDIYSSKKKKKQQKKPRVFHPMV